MTYMSYYRWHNTALDLHDCLDVAQEWIENDKRPNLSRGEQNGLCDTIAAARELIELVEDYEELFEAAYGRVEEETDD